MNKYKYIKKRITIGKDKTTKRIKLANLERMVAPIHNFDPKWVKKRLGPLEKPTQNGLYVFCIKIKPSG